jgi:phosphocarrier protein
MNSVKITLNNSGGLHTRPASLLVKNALQFKSHISIRCKNREANAKRILGILALGAQKGDELEIFAEGPDASLALDALRKLVEYEMVE